MQELMLMHGETIQVYLFFLLLLLFIIAERMYPKKNLFHPQGKRISTNLALSALAIMTLPIMPVSFVAAAAWAKTQGTGLLNLVTLPGIVLVVVTLLSRGFISFFTHWLNHKVPVLWRFHRVHHLDTELDVSSTVRFHPLEMPISMLIGLPLVVGFGLSPWVLIFYELFDVAITLFSHSNLKIPKRLDSFLRYIIATPNLHTVHHSTRRSETDSNFSAVFPIWDIIFGTFKTKSEDELESMTLGLDIRDPEANQFSWLLLSPFLPRSKYRGDVDCI
jgi:sterol desaturase/sphingolipid hydroxylase (fatty acid hydroxylase superfamily)